MTGPQAGEGDKRPVIALSEYARRAAPSVEEFRTLESLSLSEYAASRGVPSVDEVKALGDLTDIRLRIRIAGLQIALFIALNVFVAGIVVWLILFDHELIRQAASDQRVAIAAGQPIPTVVTPERIVTPQVVMALIAGTVAQVGAATLAITRYLFPQR